MPGKRPIALSAQGRQVRQGMLGQGQWTEPMWIPPVGSSGADRSLSAVQLPISLLSAFGRPTCTHFCNFFNLAFIVVITY